MRLLLVFLMGLFLFSCQAPETDGLVSLDSDKITNTTRGVSLEFMLAEEQFEKVELLTQNSNQDEDAVSSIARSLMLAESPNKLLGIEMVTSDEPVEDGNFLFNIRSMDNTDLSIRIFDEEGFEVGSNQLNLYEGNNYKNLNVKSLKDGEYKVFISDESGASLEKEFIVK